MPIFRAVRLDAYDPDQIHVRHNGQRLPKNVPYFIDNLWEYARPGGMPSRRHAVYASPTPELALAGASPGRQVSNQHIACVVSFRNEPRIFRLSVADARDHPDVKKLQGLVHDRLTNWGQRGLYSKLGLAPLFMPGTTREELSAAMKSYPELQAIVDELAAAVTIWDDIANPLSGEIIFELDADNAYTLQQI